MFEITDLKYHQCQQFRNYLLGTGDRELIHTVSDDYWGQGRNGKGLNTHGKVLRLCRTHKGLTSSSKASPASQSVSRKSVVSSKFKSSPVSQSVSKSVVSFPASQSVSKSEVTGKAKSSPTSQTASQSVVSSKSKSSPVSQTVSKTVVSSPANRIDKKSGRKQPRANDYEIEFEPAPDSAFSLDTPLKQTLEKTPSTVGSIKIN